MTPAGQTQANIDQIMSNSNLENGPNDSGTSRNPQSPESPGQNAPLGHNLSLNISNEFSDDQDHGLLSDDNEARPLLTSHFSSFYGSNDERDNIASDTEGSLFNTDNFSTYTALISDKIVKFSRRRFWWFCALGVIAVIIFNLSFLPRTSLSRDYRRLHGLHLTKDDVKRDYLVYSGDKQFEQFSNPQEIDWLLQNFTDLNSRHSVNLLAQDNAELTDFVKEKFQLSGVHTSVYSYDTNLSRPVNASVVLYKGGSVAYALKLRELEFLTPNYYGFGAAGSVKGPYIFANEGTVMNYQSLTANGLHLAGKIAIIKSTDMDVPIADKVMAAQRYGIIGLVHYMEPLDGMGASLVKRDTVVQNPYGTSNFLTPSIPVIPVSYKEISPVLDTLNAPSTAAEFELHITSEFNNTGRRLTNIVGHIDGIIKDGEIIIGASRDSLDSANPLSNHVVMLEIMRHFHKLLKLGWKPLRNIKFVLFDGGRNGQYGVQKFLEDDSIKKNVLAYINIDEDTVRGTEFDLEANPMFNHIIRKVSKAIPVPEEFIPSHDEDDDDEATLHKYWKHQSNNTVTNTGTRTGGFPFQYHFNTPTVNIRFNNGENDTRYIANSNDYSYKWVKKLDPELWLHLLLIRYVGLLVITLSEHEVVDFKTHDYFALIHEETSRFIKQNAKKFTKWNDVDITEYLEIPFFNFNGDEDEITTFGNLTNKLLDVTASLQVSSVIFDQYNVQVQRGLIQDYPWYQSYKKLKLWAQFKVSNYKLIHMDRDLSRKHGWFNHLVYNKPELGRFADSSTVFADVPAAVDGGIKKTVQVMFEMYEKFTAVDKKIG